MTAGRFDLSKLGRVVALERPQPGQPDLFKLSFDSGAVLILPRPLYYAVQRELED